MVSISETNESIHDVTKFAEVKKLKYSTCFSEIPTAHLNVSKTLTWTFQNMLDNIYLFLVEVAFFDQGLKMN